MLKIFNTNDYRFFDTNNDSLTYTYTTDYEIANQDLFDLDDEYPEKYDLRELINIKVENQGGFGLCWDYSLTKALETTFAIKHNEELDLSEMYIDYRTYKENRGSRNELHQGGFPSDYYNELLRDGICNEDELPYKEAGTC